jgi:Peptidase family M28
MTPRPRALVLVLAALAACARASTIAPAGTSAGATSADITEADLRRRLFLIADDSMMGRETGSEGAYKATEYIASEFRRLGLEPAGESGSYFQTVPFWRAAIGPGSRLEITPTPSMSVKRVSLELGRDWIPSSFRGEEVQLTGIDGTMIIYGGSLADTMRWIPASKAANQLVVLDFPDSMPPSALGPRLARWRGAKAVALVALHRFPAEEMARLREGRPVADTTRNRNVVPLIWISRSVAATMFNGTPPSEPGTIGGLAFGGFDFPRTPVAFPARNVVAVLRGSDPVLRGEYVALTAHNDHVGFDHSPVDHDSLRAFNQVVRPMGADSPVRPATPEETARIRTILDSLRRAHRPRLDSIRNGADDDGSGTVSILEIAERMARGGERPRRSILFVSHTGEETGLLGSRWYSDHPTVPRDSIVAEIDQDMIGRGTSHDFPRGGTGAGSDTYLEVIGAKRLSRAFGEMMEAANARQPIPFVFDYTYDQPGHPLQYYCRADHYSYARYGIPSLALSRGEHLDYHQITDEPQYISYRDLARVSRMVHDGALAIANADARPALDAPKPADPNVACRQ